MNSKDEDEDKENLKIIKNTSVSIGTAMSIAISYDLYHNIFWAFLHGLCGWLYVIYFLLVLNR